MELDLVDTSKHEEEPSADILFYAEVFIQILNLRSWMFLVSLCQAIDLGHLIEKRLVDVPRAGSCHHASHLQFLIKLQLLKFSGKEAGMSTFSFISCANPDAEPESKGKLLVYLAIFVLKEDLSLYVNQIPLLEPKVVLWFEKGWQLVVRL